MDAIAEARKLAAWVDPALLSGVDLSGSRRRLVDIR